MSRPTFRPFFTALALTASALLARAATGPTLDYYLPVSYDVAISRASTTTTTATTEKSAFAFELLNSRDLLRVILAAQTPAITDTRGWSLVAKGSSTTVENVNYLSTLKFGALKRDGTFVQIPDALAVSLSLNSLRAVSSTQVKDQGSVANTEDSATRDDDTLVSDVQDIAQLASLTQVIPSSIPGRTLLSGGTLNTTGYLSHGVIFNKVTVDKISVGPVYRPTGATYRAVGTFSATDPANDALAEIVITLGRPSAKLVTPTITPE